MFKVIILALTCVVVLNSAARVPHGAPVKKQALYPGYSPQYNAYQEQPYYLSYPQGQVGTQGQTQVAGGAQAVAPTSVKQATPQKSPAYAPVSNAIPTQYPFKQYYPQIYPQNAYYPSVPSVFYVQPQTGRYPANALEGTEQSSNGVGPSITAAPGGSGTTGSGSGSGTWFGQNYFPSFPQFPSNLPQFPANLPQFPSSANLPQLPSGGNLPQFPSSANFPQFPSQFPQFPSSFPTGNLPSFPGSPASPPAGSSPAVVPGSTAGEAGSGATTNAEGNSVVVVGARRPEKIENADDREYAIKGDTDKVATRYPAQQYILVPQPQYVAQVPVLPNRGQFAASSKGKDPVQLDSAAKGAVSSFLLQPQPVAQQQALSAEPSPVSQFPNIPQNKILTAQEFQQLLQQTQIANKKLVDNTNNQNLPAQFYAQQGIPQQDVNLQSILQGISPQQLQDLSSQQVLPGYNPQQVIYQAVQPAPQPQQPYIQFVPQQQQPQQQQQQQQQQFFVPQYVSMPVQQTPQVPQQKPLETVSNVPDAPNGEAPESVSAIEPAPSPAPSSDLANDSLSNPEPSTNSENDSSGNTSDSEAKNEVNEIPHHDDVSQNSNSVSDNVESPHTSTDAAPTTAPANFQVDNNVGDDAIHANERVNNVGEKKLEFGARLNVRRTVGINYS